MKLQIFMHMSTCFFVFCFICFPDLQGLLPFGVPEPLWEKDFPHDGRRWSGRKTLLRTPALRFYNARYPHNGSGCERYSLKAGCPDWAAPLQEIPVPWAIPGHQVGKPIIPHLRPYQGFAVAHFSVTLDALYPGHPSRGGSSTSTFAQSGFNIFFSVSRKCLNIFLDRSVLK